MKAVVMAGGEGTRLRPLTSNRPKPLVPILNKPIAQHIIEHLKRAGINDIVVTLYYLGEEIQRYFGDGSDMDVNLIYSVEETPLGTAGSVKQAEEHLKDGTFVIVSGDALTDLDIEKALAFHRAKGAEATLVLKPVPNPVEFGVVMTEPDGRIVRFLEKPDKAQVFSDSANTGMYILEPSVFELMESGKNYDWSQDIFPRLLEEGRPIYGYAMEEYWCDVGSLEQYRQAQYEMLEGQTALPIPGASHPNRVFVGGGTEIHPTAKIVGPVAIGGDCRIGPGAVIGPDAVLGDGAIVEANARIEKAILWRSAYVGAGAYLSACTICNHVHIGENVKVEESAVVGDKCSIEAGATIRPRVKLWPDKLIEERSVVTESLVWGAKAYSNLFRGLGVPGITNIELTPDFAAKLGASFGAFLKKGATIVVSRDGHPASRMLKRAFMAGVSSVGVSMLDVEEMALPVLRNTIRTNRAKGGVHVRQDPDHAGRTLVEFFDDRGIYLTKNNERKVETIFFREDYGRVLMDEVGTINPATRPLEQYTQLFLKQIAAKDIERQEFTVVIDYAYGSSLARVLPPILGQLGCKVFVLNPYPDWKRAPKNARDREQLVAELSKVVHQQKADLGVMIHSDGERLELVDEKGNALNRARLLATLASMVAQTTRAGQCKIAVPINAPSALEGILAHSGGTVTRTKTDPRFLMNVASASAEKIVMAGDLLGGFIFPGTEEAFHPTFDGLFAFVKTLEMMALHQRRPLSSFVAELPAMHLASRTLPCPQSDNGRVMRLLTEEAHSAPGTLELLDGIRVVDAPNAWSLILPDPAEPLIHIHSEGTSLADVNARTQRYADRIGELLS